MSIGTIRNSAKPFGWIHLIVKLKQIWRCPKIHDGGDYQASIILSLVCVVQMPVRYGHATGCPRISSLGIRGLDPLALPTSSSIGNTSSGPRITLLPESPLFTAYWKSGVPVMEIHAMSIYMRETRDLAEPLAISMDYL